MTGFRVFMDGQRLVDPPETLRAAGGDLQLEQLRAAVAQLGENAVPRCADGYYHVHVSSVCAALSAIVQERLAPGYRSWRALRRAVEQAMKPRPRPKYTTWPTGLLVDTPDTENALLQRATEDDRSKVRAAARRRVWKPQARRRRQARKQRRGWT